jgi:uncharacterized protein YjbI with pentapeptide repeats
LNSRSPAVVTAIGVAATLVLALVVVSALLHTGGAKSVSDNAAIIGALVALGGVFTTQLVNSALEDRRAQESRELEAQRAHETALQNYFEQVGKLLIEQPLRRASPGDNLSTVVRAQTLSVLEGLDRQRKRILLQLLYESALVYADKPVVSLQAANLSGAQLSHANLRGVNLRGADLREADLTHANLREADLREADLRWVDMSYANLSRANLSRASLTDINLAWAHLSGAVMDEATLLTSNLHRADLSRTDLRQAEYLYTSNLSGANLSGANLSEAYLYKAKLRGANLRGADLREADLSAADLRKALPIGEDLPFFAAHWSMKWTTKLSSPLFFLLPWPDISRTNLSSADLSGANLSRANLSKVDLRKANLNGANLSKGNLREADLSGANVTKEQLAECRSLKGATLPDGSKHD